MRRARLLAVAALVGVTAMAALPTVGAQAAKKKKELPKTGFEESNGAEWTTHEQELDFLAQVDKMSRRVDIDVIGKTIEKRPMHLVKMGHPAPVSAKKARKQPTILFACSQHGNEPAGRETCLKTLRDLAFTKNKTLVNQLRNTTVLFIPSANPDGRAENSRGNAKGVDINRDHLNLETPEAQTMAKVVRTWKPDVSLDLHEYGPSLPAVYDDEILFLWPRNLNVDPQVHGLAKTVAEEYIGKGAERDGYSSDEYGKYALADQDIHQSAGDGDEGIMRNAMGLRHSLGILVESAVTQDPRNGPDEVVDQAAVNRRRVDSQMVVAKHTLRFMREQGDLAKYATDRAPKRKAREGRMQNEPVYFGGADNEEPTEEQMADPPCGYDLTNKQFDEVRTTLTLQGIRYDRWSGGAFVPMAQAAEPVIPLLLDERGARHSVAAKPIEACPMGVVVAEDKKG